MRALTTRLSGPLLLEPTVHRDERGFFAETYRRTVLLEHGVSDEFIQDNHSRSSYGVVRGMHFHVGRGVSKLVRCARGAIADVVVDLRRGSPTFGEWESYELSDENLRLLYVPAGFAHGFCVISQIADVLYKQDAYYDTSIERGISVDDPEVSIVWPVPVADRTVSERDTRAPSLSEVADELPFVWPA